MSGLDIRYDLGTGQSMLGRRVPDLDLVTKRGPWFARQVTQRRSGIGRDADSLVRDDVDQRGAAVATWTHSPARPITWARMAGASLLPIFIAWSSHAGAYRPFDVTDADVAEPR